jgi:hypothetical protein
MRARSNELLMEPLAMLKARRTATMIPERRTREDKTYRVRGGLAPVSTSSERRAPARD